MTSTFAWLDLDEPARQRMREMVNLLSESGSVDELGLGRIRDAFSDRLFPGTSVLWRRAGYLLFVAWTYQLLEREGFSQTTSEKAARALQKKLRAAILESDDHNGLIGLRTPDPVSPPDAIIWPALGHWGLREEGLGTVAQYRASLLRRPRRSDEEQLSSISVWNPRIPPAPAGFPEAISFALRPEDAAFLRDLILADDAEAGSRAGRRADSLLADMLRADELLEVAAPWHHPLSDNASDELRTALHMSGCFSDVMHGATLLYARHLAAVRDDEDRLGTADDELSAWATRISTERPAEIEAWASDLDTFFVVVDGQRTTRPGERSFVSRFSELALADPTALAASADAQQLLVEREAASKGGKARLAAPRDKDRGDGGAIPQQLTYRWGNAWRIAQDIRIGLVA